LKHLGHKDAILATRYGYSNLISFFYKVIGLDEDSKKEGAKDETKN